MPVFEFVIHVQLVAGDRGREKTTLFDQGHHLRVGADQFRESEVSVMANVGEPWFWRSEC